jgi:enamine deaminase RidA (YjgF/YER057c/UK114 family)
MSLARIDPPGWAQAKGYAYAVRQGDRLAVSGLLGCDPATGTVAPDADFTAQWTAVFANLAQLLEAAGTSAGRVVALRIYLTSLDTYRGAVRTLGRPWRAVFGDHLPAITMVQVSALVDEHALIEVEAEAAVGDPR